MNKTDSIANLAKSLALAQKEIKPAHFDATNPHFRNRYATLASVYEACRTPLAKNGLSVIQGVTDFEGHTYLETMLVHESGEYITSGTKLIVDKESMQGLGSAITYARRYALAAMIGVVADEDDDGNQASQNPPRQTDRPKVEVKAPVKAAPAPLPRQPEIHMDLMRQVADLMVSSKVTATQLKEFTVQKYGKEKSTDLTRPQLQEVIDHLTQVSEGEFAKFPG